MTTVLITGANGFIARNLAPVLKEAGMRVAGTSRAGQPVPGFDAIYPASLGDSLRSDPGGGADRCVSCTQRWTAARMRTG